MKNKQIIIALLLITLAGAFLRFYKFEEHLLFKADQARDAFIAKDVLEKGTEKVPLLGPRASIRVGMLNDEVVTEDEKESFHIGPAYYYIQMLPALILRSASPPVLAYSDLLLSIIAIPLFYLLLKKYFSPLISLWVTAIFTASFVMVQFSRFAWNTNQLIFWELLYALALSGIQKETGRKKAGLYLLLLAFCLGIITQLHFLAFVAFPLITLIFWIFYRPVNISWRYWLGAMIIALICYSPLLVYDIQNKGANFGRLISAVNEERKKQSEEKVLLPTVNFHSLSYMNILSSVNKHELGGSSLYVGYLFILGSLILISFSYFRKQKEASRWLNKDPLQILTLTWFVIFALIYLSLPSHLHKLRYWLLISPLPFIFLAYWLAMFEKKLSHRTFVSAARVVSGLLIITNLSATASFFASLEKGQETSIARRYNSYEEYTGLVTYGQMKRLASLMAQKAAATNSPTCFLSEDRQLRNPYEYLFAYYHPDVKAMRVNLNKTYPTNCHLFWLTSQTRQDSPDDKELQFITSNYKLLSTQQDKASLLYEVTVNK